MDIDSQVERLRGNIQGGSLIEIRNGSTTEEDVNRDDDPTYAITQHRKFPDPSEPARYGAVKAYEEQVITHKMQNQTSKYYTRTRAALLADEDDEKHTVTLSDIFHTHHTLFVGIVTVSLVCAICCFCCATFVSTSSKYHPWVPIVYQPNRKTLTMRQQLEIEGASSPRKVAAEKLQKQRKKEYIDIHNLGDRPGKNVKTSAQIFDVSEEFIQNHASTREEDYTELDAAKYDTDMYAIDTEKGSKKRDINGRVINNEDESELIKNKEEMKDLRGAISEDEGSYYSSTQNSSSN